MDINILVLIVDYNNEVTLQFRERKDNHFLSSGKLNLLLVWSFEPDSKKRNNKEIVRKYIYQK